MKKFVLLSMVSSFLLLYACNHAEKMTEGEKNETNTAASSESKEDRNKKVIMASMESFMKDDIDGTFKDADTRFIDYGDGTMAPVTHIDSLKAIMRMIKSSIEGYRGENLAYYTDGDYVLVHGDWTGTFKNDLMGIKATGKTLKFKDVDIFKLNDEGKIVEHSSVQNIIALLMMK